MIKRWLLVYLWLISVTRFWCAEDNDDYRIREYTNGILGTTAEEPTSEQPSNDSTNTQSPNFGAPSNGLPSTATPNSIPNQKKGPCLRSITIHKGVRVRCSEQLIFSDDFSGNSLDPSKWKIERRFATLPDNEFVMYLNNARDILDVKNGLVIIRPQSTERYFTGLKNVFQRVLTMGRDCTGEPATDQCQRNGADSQYMVIPPLVSAQFSTKNSFSFKYGRVEIRAKLPRAEWVFPQLWLQPAESIYGKSNYQSGQIRLAHSRFSGYANELFAGVLLNSEEPFRNEKMCMAQKYLSDDFHFFTLLWTESLLIFSIDHVEFCRIEPKSESEALRNINNGKLPNREKLEQGSPLAPFDREFYLTMGYGVGGHYDFSDELPESWPQKPWVNTSPNAMKTFWRIIKNSLNQWLAEADLQIDYVKVFSV